MEALCREAAALGSGQGGPAAAALAPRAPEEPEPLQGLGGAGDHRVLPPPDCVVLHTRQLELRLAGLLQSVHTVLKAVGNQSISEF